MRKDEEHPGALSFSPRFHSMEDHTGKCVFPFSSPVVLNLLNAAVLMLNTVPQALLTPNIGYFHYFSITVIVLLL